jgi:hypothetical protein
VRRVCQLWFECHHVRSNSNHFQVWIAARRKGRYAPLTRWPTASLDSTMLAATTAIMVFFSQEPMGRTSRRQNHCWLDAQCTIYAFHPGSAARSNRRGHIESKTSNPRPDPACKQLALHLTQPRQTSILHRASGHIHLYSRWHIPKMNITLAPAWRQAVCK